MAGMAPQTIGAYSRKIQFSALLNSNDYFAPSIGSCTGDSYMSSGRHIRVISLKPKAQLTTFGPWEPPIARAERTAAGGPNRRQPAGQETNVKKRRSKDVDPSGIFVLCPP